MSECSHKDEMASALRADFARLRARGVATTLAPRAEALGQTGGADDPAGPRSPDPEALTPDPVVAGAEAREAASPGSGWLARVRHRG